MLHEFRKANLLRPRRAHPALKSITPHKIGEVFQMKAVNSALSLIGNTPMVKLTKIAKGIEANVFAKCEYFNPSGSYKDRMALRMIEEAEKEGRLKPGGTIIDQTSGNTGPALSFVGNVKGYKVKLLIPSEWVGPYNPTTRIMIMKLFGAEVEHFTTTGYEKIIEQMKPEEKSSAQMFVGMKKCHELEKSDPKVWWANQMCNPNNTAAHRDTTGKEILEQTDGKVDAWVASIGSGGTLFGVAETLRKKNPSVKVIGVEPQDTPVTDWMKNTAAFDRLFRLFGVPRMKFIVETYLEKGLPDQVMRPKDEDAREMANRLCREEGLFCGMSSGANVWSAIQVAKKMKKGENVVTVLVDRRDRYYPEHPKEHYVV
jgi:cysteine synthase